MSDGYVRYEKFRYPLYKVTGKLQVEDDVVKLDDPVFVVLFDVH